MVAQRTEVGVHLCFRCNLVLKRGDRMHRCQVSREGKYHGSFDFPVPNHSNCLRGWREDQVMFCFSFLTEKSLMREESDFS